MSHDNLHGIIRWETDSSRWYDAVTKAVVDHVHVTNNPFRFRNSLFSVSLSDDESLKFRHSSRLGD